MKVKVVYLLTSNEDKEYFEVNEDKFTLGDIVVIENEQSNVKRYGVISKVNVTTRKRTQDKELQVANGLDRKLFWLDFENKVLHNKVTLSENTLQEYRKIRDNANLTDEELNSKMTRNIILSYKGYRVKVSKSENFIFCYGNLRITYRNGNVYSIINKANPPSGWRMNRHKRWYFSKILGVKP